MDAIFSPIQRVRYLVTNARVGQRTDYDKLTLEIWSDGSVLPADALSYAAKILKEQLQIFINFAEEEEPEIEEEDSEEEEFSEALFKRVDEPSCRFVTKLPAKCWYRAHLSACR